MSIFGGGEKINYRPPGFSGGGVSATFNNGSYNISDDPSKTAAIQGSTDLSNTFGDVLGGYRAQVAPGYNQLLGTQLSDINNQARSAIGNLSQNLAARRVLGSSFGQDTISRLQAGFAKTRAETIANTTLQSLDASTKLAMQEYQIRNTAFANQMSQMNFDASLAAQLTNTASTQMAENARAQAKLDADAATGAGKFIGTIGSIALAPATGGLSLAALPAFK